MLGLVGQTGAAVLQLGDLGLGIGRRGPVRVGQPLALPLAVQPDQVVGRRRRDPALLRQPLQHLPVAFAAVAAHDRAQRRIGLHRRGVDADPVALDQAVLGQPLQHPGEDRLVHLQRQPRAGLAQPGMVGHPLGRAQAQELAQRQAVGAAPLQAALAVDPLEVADQMHPEVAARRQRRPAPLAGVVGRALAARRSRRTRPRPGWPAGDRRRRAPASAAAPPSRPSDPPAARPAAPAPCPLPAPSRPQQISPTRLRQRAASTTWALYRAGAGRAGSRNAGSRSSRARAAR